MFERYTRVTSGRNYAGERAAICPFHGDNKPSLSFNDDTGLWKCFACGKSGSAVTFVQAVEQCTHDHADALVNDLLNVSLPTPTKIAAWHATLVTTPDVLHYLESRGIGDVEVLKYYNVGFDGERVTIPIHDEEGNLVNVRRMAAQRAAKNKVINTPGHGQMRLWPLESLSGEGPIIVCEGETDCLSILHQGARAVTSTGGAGGWRQEWGALFRGQDVVIAFDGDDPGRRGAEKVCASLADHAASVTVLEMPDATDVNDLHCAGHRLDNLIIAATPAAAGEQRDEVLDLMKDIPTLGDLPKEAMITEQIAWTKRLAAALAKLPETRRAYYIAEAARMLSVSTKVIRDEIRAVELQVLIPTIPEPLAEPRQADMCLAQDWTRGRFHIGVWLPTQRGVYTFRLITSDHRMVEAPEGIGAPGDAARWSVDSVTDYNVFAWLNARTVTVDPAELQAEIEGLFRTYMWYPHEDAYKVLSLWVMASYVFMLYDCCAYLAMTGTKRAGKTRTLELIEHLAWNALKVSSFSASYLFRAVAAGRNTLLFDESDILSAAARGGQEVDERLAVVLDGYRRSGKTGRVEGENNTPRTYPTYSPKAFASMFGLPDMVTDRAIMIEVLRRTSDTPITSLVTAEIAPACQVLRNKLYCFALENTSQLNTLRQTVTSAATGLFDREFEIWQPLLSIAVLCGGDAYQCALGYAHASHASKKAAERETSMTSAAILTCQRLLIEEEPDLLDAQGKWYARARIRRRVAEIMERDEEQVRPERIRMELIKTGILSTSGTSVKQIWSGTSRGQRIYCLNPDLVMKAAQRFDVTEIGTIFSDV